MSFAATLRALLDYEGISITALAPQLGLSVSALGNYVRGYREPDFDTLMRIADYFHVSTDYLLNHSPAEPIGTPEQQLLSFYRRFTPPQRQLLLDQARLISRYPAISRK